jgi:hypothetical protein
VVRDDLIRSSGGDGKPHLRGLKPAWHWALVGMSARSIGSEPSPDVRHIAACGRGYRTAAMIRVTVPRLASSAAVLCR